MSNELIISVSSGLIVLIIVRFWKSLRKLILTSVLLLINKLRLLFHILWESFPYRIINKNKDNKEYIDNGYVYIYINEDNIELKGDINSRFHQLKVGDIRRISIKDYNDIVHKDCITLLYKKDVICVRYSDSYMDWYIKDKNKTKKLGQNYIDALKYDMSHERYILKNKFDDDMYIKIL